MRFSTRMDLPTVVKLSLLLMSLIYSTYGAMNDAQLKATGKLVRNVCQPKNKVTDEDIDKMHTGDWNVDRTAMCYMQCVLNSQKLMTKENTLDYEYAINVVKKTLPVAKRDPSLIVLANCKDSAKTLDDKCVAAHEISKCIYEANPEVYIFP